MHIGSRRGSGTFLPPWSPTQLSPFNTSRQRSASLCSPKRNFLGLGGLQKKTSTVKHNSMQKIRTLSQSLDEPATSGIDSDLARIRSQLVCTSNSIYCNVMCVI